MRELSLNVMDIVQNSVRAGASLITVQVAESKKHDTLIITITDNEREVKGYGKINAADGLEQLEHIW